MPNLFDNWGIYITFWNFYLYSLGLRETSKDTLTSNHPKSLLQKNRFTQYGLSSRYNLGIKNLILLNNLVYSRLCKQPKFLR